MCGIAGILVGDQRPVDDVALGRMTRALAARGPDGEGFHVAAPIGLGHRRLAVIDVAGGRQPLLSEDGAIAAVVNGEVYNFAVLRAELERLGHRFATRSDSEVLVHGYESWGDDVLARLEGMFALALWDARRRRLLLARDRMGEKPLYWAPLPGGGLAFASELRALRHAPGIRAEVDPTALAAYLVHESVPAPATILRGVHKLEPATRLVVEPGRAPDVAPYWSFPFELDERRRERDPETASARLLVELRRSVRERLVSDVPLGVFLSGGIDSSAVAALAAEARGGDLDTFSIGFDDPSYDETPHARRVAAHIGSRHHEERLSPRAVLDLLPAVGRLLDEPLGDPSIVPTLLLARFARRTVTVALGGDGGDELFAGYPTFQAERLAAVIDRAPRAVREAAARVGSRLADLLPVRHGYLSFDFKVRRFVRGAALTGAHRHQAWLGALAPLDALALLAPDAARDVATSPDEVVARRLAACAARDPWDRLLYFYARGFLADQVLTKVDRATMSVGLEARAPLLDSRIVELACRVGPSLRLRGLETKHLLKRALRGVLPPEILGRRKQGFAMPIGGWLRAELRALLEEDLGARRLARDGLFEAAPIRRMIDEHVAGRADHRKPLWTLLAFQRWKAAWDAEAAVDAGAAAAAVRAGAVRTVATGAG